MADELCSGIGWKRLSWNSLLVGFAAPQLIIS